MNFCAASRRLRSRAFDKVAAVVSPARKAAYRILREVEQGRAHSDELLRAKHVGRLSEADRNLTTALVLGVLRWQIRLDHEIKQFLAKPNAKLDAEVRIALRLGALQIERMERIPARAAIDESVELTKFAGHRFAARMVNAVLRKFSERAEKLAEESKNSLAKPETEDSPAALALSSAHPLWLVERWSAHFGLEAARRICEHGQAQPTLALRFAEETGEAEVVADGLELAPGALLAQARTILSGDSASVRVSHENRIRIQDEGSQLVAELAASAAPQAKQIADLCAVPGGKTLILAERHPQAHIVACELGEQRYAGLAKRLAPLAGHVECRCMDATALPADSGFDLILADVPCSGTGTFGRNPEIRHRLHAEDFARQAERQRAILSAALRALRPGGKLVYSTCSLEFEENDEVVAAALAENSQARQLSLAESIEALNARGLLVPGAQTRLQTALTPQGALRLLPGLFPTDGFFVALLERAD